MAFTLDIGSPVLPDTEFFLSNIERRLGTIRLIDTIAATPGVATSSATLSDTLPAGAIVLGATYTVTAKPAGLVTIDGVAQVRQGTGSELVVDFGGLRTVNRLQAPVAISSIKPWVGTQFAPTSVVTSAATDQQFTEIQTERLLVVPAGTLTAADLAAHGSVAVLSPPADLELVLNGTRAWFNAGPAKPGGSPTDPAAYETTVDLTAAVRAAVEAAPPSPDGTVPIDVVLNSSVPGQLALARSHQFQRTFVVRFPEGDTRVVEAAKEGIYEVVLPLVPESADWQIHEVHATVSGALPPPRVLPPDGPVLSGEAELVLDPDHAVLVGLPPAGLAPLAILSAIRLPLGVDAGGAELAGVLHGAAPDGGPGEPLPDGQLGPVTLAAGHLADRAWTSLPLAKEHKLAPAEALWLGLQLARGRVSWPLARPAPPATPPALSADAPLRRRLPNGAFRPLSTAGDVSTTAGAIRLVGEPPGASPIPAIDLGVVLDEEGTAVGVPPFTPTSDGVPIAIRLDPPLTRAGAPAAFDALGALRVQLTTKTAGSVSCSDVRIAYTDGEES
jgi:hypothetical protein